MLMSKKNRVAIFEHLFKEGVMVAKKDNFAPKHPVDIIVISSSESVLTVFMYWDPYHSFNDSRTDTPDKWHSSGHYRAIFVNVSILKRGK